LSGSPGCLDVLDYGTFDGNLLVGLDRSGLLRSGLGVDLNSEAIHSLFDSTNGNVSLRSISKGQSIPAQDESFDAVTLIGVLEHVFLQVDLLKEIHRVLRKDGILIVAVPGQHVFSFLDLGNFKFRFPRLHRRYYEWRHGVDKYENRYIRGANGLIGDIEIEKR